MFGKILVVFVTVTSVLLAGASIIATFAVPGMAPAMNELQDYSFEAQPGERVTWTVKHRLDDRTVASSKNAFEAVIAARKDQVQRLQTETSELNQQFNIVQEQQQVIEAEQQQDIQAMAAQATQKQELIDSYLAETRSLSEEFQNLTIDARENRDTNAARRLDVVRLQAELEELRTSVYGLQELQRILTDRLLRLQLDTQAVQQRTSQLQAQ